MSFYKRYFFYLIRWQLSTPILAPIMILLASQGMWVSAIVANLIGGLFFFFVDRKIFRSKLRTLWEVNEDVKCADCGNVARGYRLVQTENYDASDKVPEFRCERCSRIKTEKMKQMGVKV